LRLFNSSAGEREAAGWKLLDTTVKPLSRSEWRWILHWSASQKASKGIVFILISAASFF
jgi:hypothetical protein